LGLGFNFGLSGLLVSIIPNYFLRATLPLCVNSQGPLNVIFRGGFLSMACVENDVRHTRCARTRYVVAYF